MTGKEIEDFIHRGEMGFLAFAMIFGDGWAKQAIDIAKALRARLTQPEPEPVAWISHNAGLYHGKPDESLNPLPLYTTPPQREWQGLTDDEINTAAYNNHPLDGIRAFARAVESKLKEKNS
jgi:hypothetical protein